LEGASKNEKMDEFLAHAASIVKEVGSLFEFFNTGLRLFGLEISTQNKVTFNYIKTPFDAKIELI
jgi:hypothetical protein